MKPTENVLSGRASSLAASAATVARVHAAGEQHADLDVGLQVRAHGVAQALARPPAREVLAGSRADRAGRAPGVGRA